MLKKHLLSIVVILVAILAASCQAALPSTGGSESLPASMTSDPTVLPENARVIYLAGGCFWGVEAYMSSIDGVLDAVSGYANGTTENPSYQDVALGNTGHAETVQVTYDVSRISLEEILIYYFAIIDPTSLNKQGNDVGSQYRTGIYYTDAGELPAIERRMQDLQKSYSEPVVVEVEPLQNFYPAEAYHQDYLTMNPGGYCHIDLSLAQVYVIRSSRYPKPPIDEIRENLTDLQFAVTQQNETEPAFDNLYDNNYETGIYVDIVTGEPLFSSEDKFHSGTGWPSFTRPIASYVVTYHEDSSSGFARTEVRSRSGDSHLGHVFEDGPVESGGLRYCINSAALRFIPLAEMANEGYEELVSWLD